ncbi:MAG: histidine--tRNA ligase, partial [Pseudomonadota bacterium]
IGPMFRYERPQKGRYRQFHQADIEAFGYPGPDIDIEMLAMTARLWRQLGISRIRLEINSLGTAQARQAYREVLVRYFEKHHDVLDADSQRRLGTNPMRILDSKNPDMAEVIAAAPSLTDHLDAESAEHFAQLQVGLDALGIEYTVNPRLVRGLDYYSRTVFEWITDALGAQGAVCSGGRYDGLFEQIGGKSVPGIGWAIGIERLLGVLEAEQRLPERVSADVYIINAGEGTEVAARETAEALRDANSHWRVIQHLGDGSMKSQLKQADRSGAQIALIIGEQELADGTVMVKPLRSREDQRAVSQAGLVDTVSAALQAV